jgi:hypothetical protein
MSNHSSTAEKIRELIGACASLEPLALVASDLLTELEQVTKTVEHSNCDEIARIFFEMCTARDGDGRFLPNRKAIDYFQRVLLLSIVEKMNFPDSNQAEGFHYWADKCSCELMDIGGSFFEQEEESDLELVLEVIKQGRISNFALTSMIASLYVLETQEMKSLLTTISHPLVWMGAFANSEFARGENVPWIIENLPSFEAEELVALIEESPIGNIAWEYPFLQFSREDEVTDDAIAYIVKILELGFTFRNEHEVGLAAFLVEYEDENDELPERFLERVIEICESDEEVRRAAENSSLTALVEALEDI